MHCGKSKNQFDLKSVSEHNIRGARFSAPEEAVETFN